MEDQMEVDSNILDSLKSIADDIIKISLKCQVGALQVTPGSKAVTKEQELLEWLSYERWLTRQVQEYRHTVSSKDSLEIHDPLKLSPEEIAEKEFETKKNIDAMKEEIFGLAVKNSILEKLLERLEANDSYLKIIFAQQTDPLELRRLHEALLFRDQLVSEFLKEHEDCKTLRERLDHLKKENRTLKQDIRETKGKLDQISKEKKKADPSQQSAVVTRKKEELKNMEARNAILRNVIQNLVLESGVSWAEDDELRELMLQLESTFV